MMKRSAWILTIIGLVVVFGFMGWALYTADGLGGSWTGGSPVIAAMIVLGVVGAGGLGVVLMWLAFYSARKGFDDRVHYDDEP